MTTSTATAQRCLYCNSTFPLYPPMATGCPNCATDDFKAPLELVYDYPNSADWLPEYALPGLIQYEPLLPPLAEGLSMGEGGTPLVPNALPELEGTEVYIKDESRNPTWSHKDRLNLAISSAALMTEARGVVAASSGNHGASAAAYSARAGLPGVILCTPRPPAVASFLQAFGQTVVAVPTVEARWELMARLVEEFDYHPASNQTIPPTNHPFGAENYKTIAYELYLQLGRRAPEAVFVPVGYAELFFGIYKGFTELLRYGLIDELPQMVACEPAAGAPLKKAVESDQPIAYLETEPTDAYAIAVPVNSYRGVVAIRESNGHALAIEDAEMVAAQRRLSRAGLWVELSAAISLAGLLHAEELGLSRRGPLVAVSTSSGFKDLNVGADPVPEIDGSWQSLLDVLERAGLSKDGA